MKFIDTLRRDAKSLRRTFAESPRLLGRVIQWSLLFRLLNAIILIPVGGLITSWLVAASGKSVISNYDIAQVLTSPQGILLGIVLVAWIVSVTFFEEAGQLLLVQAGYQGDSLNLFGALRMTVERTRELLKLSAFLVLMLAIVAVPFLLIGGGLYVLLLGTYDINYYMIEEPAEWRTAMWCAVLLVGLFALICVGLIARLFYALPACVLHKQTAVESLRWSWKQSRTTFWFVLRTVGLLVAFHLMFAVIVGLLLQIFEWTALGIAGHRLTWVVVAIAFVLLFNFLLVTLWSLVVVTTNSLVLFQLFASRLDTDDASDHQLKEINILPQDDHSSWAMRPSVWVIGLLIGLGVTGLTSYSALSSIELEDRSAVTAHRGDVSRAPENSLSAVKKAIELGCDYIEIDVQETADGHVVLAHDADWKRVAGDSRRVWDTTLAEIKTFDIGSHNSAEFAGEGVPTLAEVIDACQGRVKLNIELKPSDEQKRLVSLVVDLIREKDFVDQCIISSLKFDALNEVRRLAPEIALCANISVAVGDIDKLDVEAVSINQGNLDRARLEKLHRRGYEVHVWTVNDRDGMNRFLEMGVDNILTDEPGQLIQLIEDRSQLDVVDRLLLRFRLLMR